MSYDVDLVIKNALGENFTVVEVGNYTTNVAPMWKKALGYPLRDLHKRRAGDVVDEIAAAVAVMVCEPEQFREMNPDNGCGDNVGAMQYLVRLYEGCRRWPDATIHVST
jgi:hypothetical protein